MHDKIVYRYLEEVGKYSYSLRNDIEVKSNVGYTHLLIFEDNLVFLKEKKKKPVYLSFKYYQIRKIEKTKGFFRSYDYSMKTKNGVINFNLKNKKYIETIENVSNRINLAKPPLLDENGDILANYHIPSDQYIISSGENLVGWYHRLEDYDKAKTLQGQSKWEGRLKNIEFKLEPENDYDSNAIAVYVKDIKVGYFAQKSKVREKIRPLLEKGESHRLYGIIVYDYDKEDKMSENFMGIYIR